MTLVGEIKQCIEQQLDKKHKKFIIYPFGDIGMQIRKILKDAYDVDAEYILDNYLSKYNSNIKPLSFLKTINCEEYVLFFASKNPDTYMDMKKNVMEYLAEENIAELSSMKTLMEMPQEETVIMPKTMTEVGKYSYGPLCNHWLVESVGAFSSFADGCCVVENHPLEYVSLHPFLYYGNENCSVHNRCYDDYQEKEWYFPGVLPKRSVKKLRRINIGNDVWLGANVIITNGANIGNGVVAGAGAVITKDVPDYAVVAGVPARILRYRYTPEQIEALNRIQWWNWTDEEIRERHDDLYLPIDEFISKYDIKN